MYNLLLGLGAAALAFLIGYLAAGWVAGLVPAVLAFGIVYFLLARRSMRAFEAIAKDAMSRVQTGNADGARAHLLTALPLRKWQFLIEPQVHGQVGQLDYMQAVGLVMQRQLTAADAKFAEAVTSLEKSWSRDWRSRAMLGVVHARKGRTDEAIAVFEAATGGGGSEPLYWGQYAWALSEAKRRDQALAVIGRGLAELKGNKSLVAVQEALSNRKRPDFGAAFGETWYQLFPDQMSQEQLAALYEQTTGKKVPAGARFGAPGPGEKAANGPIRPPKTFPMPRR